MIVDEVHERSLDSDFLLIVLKELMRARRDIKVVLMSATLDADLFARYFTSGGIPGGATAVVSIPGFTHPVRDRYLEDVLDLSCESPAFADLLARLRKNGRRGGTKSEKGVAERRREDVLRAYVAYSMETRETLAALDEEKLDPALLEHLIFQICEEGEHLFPELAEVLPLIFSASAVTSFSEC